MRYKGLEQSLQTLQTERDYSHHKITELADILQHRTHQVSEEKKTIKKYLEKLDTENEKLRQAKVPVNRKTFKQQVL